MRKYAKRIFAWLMAFAMVLSLSDPVMAAGAAEQPEAAVTGLQADGAEVVTLAPALAPAGASQGGLCYVHWDANGDGALTNKDALYVLGNVTYGSEAYPLDEGYDVNGDSKVNTQDAIALLYCSIWPDTYGERYSWQGTIHSYDSEPLWVWEEDASSATARFYCSCQGGDVREVKVDGAAITERKTKQETCLETGSKTLTAKVEFQGKIYTDERVITIPATGHVFDKAASCTESRVCVNDGCNYVEPAMGHSFPAQPDAKKSTPATCTEPAKVVYTCTKCGSSTAPAESGAPLGHTLAEIKERKADPVNAASCEYEQYGTCTVTGCGADVVTGTVYKHSCKAFIKTPATCKAEGVKSYKCSVCGKTHTAEGDGIPEDEVIPADANAHAWVEQGTAGGKTTYKCSVCGAEKTAVVSDSNTAQVSKSDLADSELALSITGETNKATVKLDEGTLGALTGSDVTISADTVNKSALTGVSTEALEQIGDNKVYNFTMESDGNAVTDFGETAGEKNKVTISLPYELQDGDDPDCIDIWYIADNGQLTVCQGTYSNGYVTFDATHFSYYTITRLKPAQRCEVYGHVNMSVPVPATCEQEGYTVTLCARCGNRAVSDKKPKLGHDLALDKETPATCKTAGSRTEKCSRCNERFTTVISATGHKWVEDEKTEPTCTVAGSQKYVCSNAGCTESYEEVIAALKHEFKEDVVAATCETKGYTLHTCTRAGCGYSYEDAQTPALGHIYKNEFSWNDDLSQAAVTLTCTRPGCTSKVVKDAAIEEKTTKETTCETGGEIKYVAKLSYNQKVYEDTKTVGSKAPGHKLPADYEKDARSHFKTCEKCGEKVLADVHSWTDPYVLKAATCVEDGTLSYKCDVCGYTRTETIPMTGAHDFDANGVCTMCGFKQNNCKHDNFHAETVSLSGQSGVCKDSAILVYTCDCGEVISDVVIGGGCRPTESGAIVPDGKGGFEFVQEWVCTECGLTLRKTDQVAAVEGASGCVGVVKYTAVVSMGNTTIREYRYQTQEMKHPMSKVVDTLKVNGACGETAYVLSCDCGQNSQIDYGSTDCNWTWMPGNENEELNYCSECQVIRTRSAILSADKSTMSYSVSYKDNKGKLLGSLQAVDKCAGDRGDCVDFETEFVLSGTTCADGVRGIYTCKDCGRKTEGISYGHYWPNFDTVYDLSKDGVGCKVVVETCLCGERHIVADDWDGCDWEWTGYDEKTGRDIFTCGKCGATREQWERLEETGAGCYDARWVGNYIYKNKSGKVVLSVDTTNPTFNHPNVKREVTLLGDSCEDGMFVKLTCSVCNRVDAWYASYHELNAKESYDLSEYGLCGGTAELAECDCGEKREIWTDERCDWRGMGWSEVEGCDIEVCAECGATRKFKHEAFNKQADCSALVRETVIFISGDGAKKLELASEVNAIDHDFDYRDPMFVGTVTNCEDGYEVIFTCKDCGETVKETRDYHERYPVASYDFKTDFGFCGGSVTKYVCACGAEQHLAFVQDPCKWNWISYDAGTNTQVDKCSVCGVTRTWSRTLSAKDPDCACDEITRYTYVDKTDKKVLELEARNKVREHNFGKASFTLKGSSCEDGYYYTMTCKDCGETDRGYNEHHQDFTINVYELADYGYTCGGTVEERGCPCGESHWIKWNEGCDWGDSVYDPATEVRTFTCRKCGGVRKDSFRDNGGPGCVTYGTQTYTYPGKNGKSFSLTEKTEFWHHDFEVVGIERDKDVSNWQSCEDGYTMTEVCRICQFEHIIHRDWHETYAQTRYDLAEKGLQCGGVIELRTCACGQNRYLFNDERCRWNWRESNDPQPNVNEYECANCGAVKVYTRRDGAVNGCEQEVSESYRYLAADGKTVLLEFSYDAVYPYHDWDYHFVNKDGNPVTNCEDGFYERGTCKRCGEVLNDNYLTTTHRTYKTEEYDFNKLGIACGGNVEKWSCPCGAEEYYNIDDNCNWQFVSNENSVEVSRCSKCGIVRRITRTEGAQVGCFAPGTETYVYTREGSGEPQVVLSFERKVNFSHHDWDYRFESVNGGPVTNCEDGYRMSAICRVCGEEMRDSHINRDHYTYKTGEYVLSRDDGFCGGVVEKWSCPCGQQQNTMDGPDSKEGCAWVNTPSSIPYAQVYKCSRCASTKIITEARGPLDGCRGPVTRTYTYQNSDNFVKLTFSLQGTYTEHDWDNRFVAADGGSTINNCEDGYYVYATCKRPGCGEKMEDNQMITDHRTYEIGEYVFSSDDGFCDGVIVECSCPCGQQRFVVEGPNSKEGCTWVFLSSSNNEPVYQCSTCKATKKVSQVYGPLNGCVGSLTTTKTYTNAAGTKTITITTNGTYSEHEWDYEYTFVKGEPGNYNCEDGYYAKGRCINCGETFDDTAPRYYHTVLKTGTKDLKDYGLCGGTIDYYGCACGREHSENYYNQEVCDWELTYSDPSGAASIDKYTCRTCKGTREVETTEGAEVNGEIPVTMVTVLKNSKGETVETIINKFNRIPIN